MASGPKQPNPYVAKPAVLPPPKENAMGIAGFIVSAIGIVTCGVLSIFGVILSAIGLRKEPKGMAIAGLILGLIGLVLLAGMGFLMFAGIQGAQQLGLVIQDATVKAQMHGQAREIGQVWTENERLPSQEEGDQLIAGTMDVWGNPIEYETDGFTFSLRSPGQDGIAGNGDDITVGPFADADSAQEPYQMDGFEFDAGDFDNEIEAEMEKLNEQLEQQMNELDEKMEESMDKLEAGMEKIEEATDRNVPSP